MTEKVEHVDIRRWRGSPTAQDVGEPYHSNWQAADTERGVHYVAAWENPYAGFAEHARRLARALDSAGMPVKLRSIDARVQLHERFDADGDNAPVIEQYSDLLARTITHNLVEVHQVIGEAEYFQRLATHRHLTPEQLEVLCRFRIVSTVFERTSLSTVEAKLLKRFGQVWVATKKDVQMLNVAGLDLASIRRIPICFYPDDPLLKLRGTDRKPGPVRFYHIGKWEPRKAQHEMLGAFFLAFKPGEAKLIMRTSEYAKGFVEGYPSSPAESITRWLVDDRVAANGWTEGNVNRSLHWIKQAISARKILELHETGDIYLSLSRGEGFDMPAFDSQLAGNMMVYTPSGGPQDFASQDAIRVEPTGLVSSHPFYRWKNGSYLDWDIEDAASKLRLAWTLVRTRAQPRLADLRDFQADVVGAEMRRAVEQHLARHVPKEPV